MTVDHAPVSILMGAPLAPPAEAGVLEAAEALAADSTPDEIAAELEALEAVTEGHKTAADRARAARGVLAHRLEATLRETGEVATAPSGRVAFSGLVAEGRATVKLEEALELADDLPDDLRPRQEHRLPTVTALRAALKAKRIDRATYRRLVSVPRRVHGLRWRTLDDEEV